ncbi:MAG: undecaprenyl diphosphate synthase family protein [Haloarculaceae archaeon]
MDLYDAYLSLRLRLCDAPLPKRVALVITERDLLERGAYETMAEFFGWAIDLGAHQIVVYVRVLDEGAVPTLRRQFEAVEAPVPVAVRSPDDDEQADAPVQVSLGLGGKHELAGAIRSLAADVADGDLDPEDIDPETVEDRLVFPVAPDLVIKTGAERLSDFMIWQSVYAELYFTDVNWRNFRRRDYLRALRDYQQRQRRFGR